MSIRTDILNAINEGITSSSDIIEKFSINPRSFHNSIRFLLKQGWITSQQSSTFNSTAHYEITTLGNEIIEKSLVDQPGKTKSKTPPDYHAMRTHLRADKTINDSKLITLWNDQTDFYLPYLGDEALRPMNTN